MGPALTGERLTLEPLRPGHTEDVVRVFADPATNRYFPIDLSDPAAAVATVRERLGYAGPPELGHWCFRYGSEIVGIGHLKPSVALPGNLIEIGWTLRPDRTGLGLATEAVRLLTDHALGPAGVPAVWALIHSENRPSARLAGRVGFVRVGRDEHYGALHEVYVKLPEGVSPCGSGR